MVETRLIPIIDDSVIHVEGISVVWQDRNTGGGGVALYVKDTLKVIKSLPNPIRLTLEN